MTNQYSIRQKFSKLKKRRWGLKSLQPTLVLKIRNELISDIHFCFMGFFAQEIYIYKIVTQPTRDTCHMPLNVS